MARIESAYLDCQVKLLAAAGDAQKIYMYESHNLFDISA